MSEPLAVPAENSENTILDQQVVTSDSKLKKLRSSTHYHFASFFKDEPLEPYVYLLSRNMENGHTCLPLKTARDEADKLPEKRWFSYLQDIEVPASSRHVSCSPEIKKPFVLYNNRLYLQRYFSYEQQIAGAIQRIVDSEKAVLKDRKLQLRKKRHLIEQLFGNENLPPGLTAEERIHWQLLASLTGFLHNFTIITGGPGTGKTTTVAKLLALLYDEAKPLRVVVAAPTGKAAVRLSDSLGKADIDVSGAIRDWLGTIKASTIHTLLKSQRNSNEFRHNAANPLPADVVLIDESSMIDVAMFARLLDAVPAGARVILLGDKNQLASVEAGSLFGDLCQLGIHLDGDLINCFPKWDDFDRNDFISDSNRLLPADRMLNDLSHPLAGHIVELKFSWRSQSQPLIGQFSKMVVNGEKEWIKDLIHQSQHPGLFIDTAYTEAKFESFIAGYKKYLDKDMEEYNDGNIIKAITQFSQIKVLCAVREGKFGVDSINKRVETYLKKAGLLKPSYDFYENQPVMVTRNNKALQLSNGDIGLVRKDKEGNLKAFFLDYSQTIVTPDGQEQPGLKAVNLVHLSEVDTAFAMTIHKSQGSEYKRVLVLLPDNVKNALLTRELLYTAVTRAKEEVLVQGAEEVIIKTVEQQIERVSGIAGLFDFSTC